MTQFIRIVVIDDHALIRHALRSLIAARADLELVAEGASGEELLSIVAAHQPDVVILDLNMPQSTVKSGAPESFMALQELTRLHRDYPEMAVIILSEHLVPSLVQQALQVGVRGYILKSDDLSINLPKMIHMSQGKGVFLSSGVQRELFGKTTQMHNVRLTLRQTEIMNTIATAPDASYAQHAAKLNIQPASLKNQLHKIYKQLDVTNLTAAMIRCHQLGIVSLDQTLHGKRIDHL